MIDPQFIQDHNKNQISAHAQAFDHVSSRLSQRGLDVDTVMRKLAAFEVAIPSWALGTGGTRFGRFPGAGEPRDIFEKMDDIAVVHQLSCSAPTVSLHIPWDEPDDPTALKQHAEALGLGFDAVNSNTFQDQPGQKLSYKYGSLCHTDASVRSQAIEHNLHVIEVGKTLGSKAITIWLADGSNFPGQVNLRQAFERTLSSLQLIYAGLPTDWRLFTEHKPYEPAFYSTVVQDWGSSFLLALNLGPQALCLVDLGHHLPNVNIEQVVARLAGAGKLGGFHFNDSKYGDDDLTTGSIRPYQLFLVFNELVDAELAKLPNFSPAYMIDQSHNLKDPAEALLQSVEALQRSLVKALIIDRDTLSAAQESNDVMIAERTIQQAFETDVSSIVAESRLRRNGAIDLIAAFRDSGYRNRVAKIRESGGYVPPQSL